jgi:hypothetical protein
MEIRQAHAPAFERALVPAEKGGAPVYGVIAGSNPASPAQSSRLVGFAVPLTSDQLAAIFIDETSATKQQVNSEALGGVAAGLSAVSTAGDMVALYSPEWKPYLTGPVEGVAFVAATASLGEALLAHDVNVTDVAIKAAKWGVAGATLVADVAPIPGVSEFKPQIQMIGLAVRVGDSLVTLYRKATKAEAKKASEIIATEGGHTAPRIH